MLKRNEGNNTLIYHVAHKGKAGRSNKNLKYLLFDLCQHLIRNSYTF